MVKTCKNCGHEIEGNSPICMYCGAAIPEEDISQETKVRLMTEATDKHRAANASSTRAIGAFLMILGILADVVSMFLIVGSSYGAFSVITIGGTICFLIGLMLFRNS